jgi:hypothetical protein
MDIPNPFKKKPTMEELQQRNEYADQELSLKRKQALMRELEQQGGKDKWKEMSSDGTKKGISFQKIMAWLKSH